MPHEPHELQNLLQGVSSERASVLVVGDRSVGKSSLKHLICAPAEDCAGTHAATSSGGGSGSRTFLRAGGGPTVGCSVEVKLVVSNGRQQFIELWEMGGASQYAALRSMLQAEVPFHGIILVHDMTNRRSFENMLEVWIPEVMKGHLEGIAAGAGGGKGSSSSSSSLAAPDRLQRRSGAALSSRASSAVLADAAGASPLLEWHQAVSTCPDLPLLVVGTKSELAGAGAASLEHDTQTLHPLPCVQASCARGSVEPQTLLDEFLERVVKHAATARTRELL